MATCRICRRRCAPSSDLCQYHLRARRNLDAAYKQWSDAYGSITWKDYLERIIASPETGTWAKEVAQQLLRDGGVP